MRAGGGRGKKATQFTCNLFNFIDRLSRWAPPRSDKIGCAAIISMTTYPPPHPGRYGCRGSDGDASSCGEKERRHRAACHLQNGPRIPNASLAQSERGREGGSVRPIDTFQGRRYQLRAAPLPSGQLTISALAGPFLMEQVLNINGRLLRLWAMGLGGGLGGRGGALLRGGAKSWLLMQHEEAMRSGTAGRKNKKVPRSFLFFSNNCVLSLRRTNHRSRASTLSSVHVRA